MVELEREFKKLKKVSKGMERTVVKSRIQGKELRMSREEVVYRHKGKNVIKLF